MFKTFFLSEIKFAVKQPMVWIFMGMMALLVYGATVSDNVQIGGAIGNIHKNAPHVLTVFTTIMSIFGLLFAVAFFNNAALRDYNNNFNEILFSSPLDKSGYFFGRFFGALILSTIPLLGVFVGSWLGTLTGPVFGWIDADRFGPNSLLTYFNNYLLFIIPNMFFAGTILFAIANRWRSTVVSFLGALIIIIAYIISGTLLSDIDNETIAALSDSFGIRAYTVVSKYYTPAEKNILNPGFGGLLLINRLIWVSLGTAVLMLSYFTFSFKERQKKAKKSEESKKSEKQNFALPQVNLQFGNSSAIQHFISFYKTNLISMVKSVTFITLFLFSAIVLIANLLAGFDYFGLQSYPVTYKVIDKISTAAGLYVIIVLVFFTGELVWRDRESKINEVIDASPHNSIFSVAAKVLSLITITSMLHVFFIFCGIAYQLFEGYTRLEIGIYLQDFFLTSFVMYVTWSCAMVMIQVLVNQKYIGYFVSIAVVFFWSLILLVMDVESNMIDLASRPSLQYSDMNKFGPGLIGAIWFNLYWVFFALICLSIAAFLWIRGTRNSIKDRYKAFRKSGSLQMRLIFYPLLVIWIALAAFVYYNTQVLNPYKTSDEQEEIAVAYEKKYKSYEGIDLPKVQSAVYDIEIFPEERDVYVNAKVWVKNETENPIDSIPFTIDQNWNPEINIPDAELRMEDKELYFRVYNLKKPLSPGDSLLIEYYTSFVTKGFTNNRGNTNVVRNGTFLNNFAILPTMGYEEGVEVDDKNDRKKYGLPEKQRMPKLVDACNELCNDNYLSRGKADYIPVETFISTSEDQIAIAPGSLISEKNENGRNYYHYRVDHPSMDFYSFISADYQIKKRKWNGIDIEVYFHEDHEVNIDMMLDAVERSLKYYTENFGPYYHKQCRIVEFPRYASFAQAFPGTMPYSEALGFIVNLEDEDDNNVIDAVIAHEMAHQWWAHQVIGAKMQGATMLSESFSEYSSLMTMKKLSNDDPVKMREFLKYDHDRYLRGRTREVDYEVPLYKVENQGHIHYGKGSVILYALQDYIGEEKVNNALKSFLDSFKYVAPPYPRSLDFMPYLEREVPDSLSYLIDDWFKKITLYDNRILNAEYTEVSENNYEVEVEFSSQKLYADSLGNESPGKINDWIDVGFFADSDEEELISIKRVKVDQKENKMTFKLSEKPEKAVIDPKRLLIDRVYKDNSKSIGSAE